MAATTKLTIYNDALRELAAAPLANTTTANTRLAALDGAFDHAVEYILARMDWNFARRRATLTGVTDSSYPPYQYRYSRPTDYLRKVWVKSEASDPFQIDHAEAGANLFGYLSLALIEYISDEEDNYTPANWPPHFTRCLVLYLALLVGPAISSSDDRTSGLWSKLATALSEAEGFEAVSLTNTYVDPARLPVMRRALEIMGQAVEGSAAVQSQADKLRSAMNQSFDHVTKYCLEQGAWNWATRRALLTEGGNAVPGGVTDGIIEGYVSGTPATETDPTVPDIAGWEYGFALPLDYLHKIWIKSDANTDIECPHQFMGAYVYANFSSIVMEYVSLDSDAINPDNWPATFLDAVAAQLALTVAPEFTIQETGKGPARINPTGIKENLTRIWFQKLGDAKMKDAANQYPTQVPRGYWARARLRGNTEFMRWPA